MSQASAPSHRVLVVDDEPNIVDVVSMALRYQGFEVASAATGQEALAAVERFRPELMVLDVMLPDMEGFEVAERLGAQRGHIPIIFLTARDATAGQAPRADDRRRRLRHQAVQPRGARRPHPRHPAAHERRRRPSRAGSSSRTSSSTRTRARSSRGGELIELTVTEYRLLRYLMLNPRRVLTRAQILDHVWEYDFGGDARVLETYISYLRKKLDQHGPSLIHTARGVGYALRAPRR